jgi:hypothetical protein
MPSQAGGGVRLKILIRPIGNIDGISLDQFRVGEVYASAVCF